MKYYFNKNKILAWFIVLCLTRQEFQIAYSDQHQRVQDFYL